MQKNTKNMIVMQNKEVIQNMFLIKMAFRIFIYSLMVEFATNIYNMWLMHCFKTNKQLYSKHLKALSQAIYNYTIKLQNLQEHFDNN